MSLVINAFYYYTWVLESRDNNRGGVWMAAWQFGQGHITLSDEDDAIIQQSLSE